MSELELTPSSAVVPKAAVKRPRRPKLKFKDTWWRHAIGILAICAALFPVVYIISSAFNSNNSLQSAQVIPSHVTLDNFSNLLHNTVKGNTGATQDAPYPNWFLILLILDVISVV